MGSNKQIYMGPYALVYEKDGVNYFDLTDEMDHALTSHGFLEKKEGVDGLVPVETWFPNIDRSPSPPTECDLDREFEGHVSMPEYSVEEKIKWFRKAYAKELALIEKAHGNIEITWGLLSYFD